jgi:putative transcriptional regulator
VLGDDAPPTLAGDLVKFVELQANVLAVACDIHSGRDIADLRTFVGLTQKEFALALGISIRTLQGREQDRRRPDGPALARLRIAARHPRIIRENLASAA